MITHSRTDSPKTGSLRHFCNVGGGKKIMSYCMCTRRTWSFSQSSPRSQIRGEKQLCAQNCN